MDALSLGVEFAKATIQRPEDWRRMVKKIRGLYSGHLTYSANWGEEFEKFSFWQDFDYIGLNCYYPLSNKEEINKNELKQHFRKVLDKIKKISVQYDKPVVFTEIGFRSVAKAWENPHAEANGRAYDENAQDICYEVVFEGIKGKDWCKGILWWKWPTYLAYRGRDNTGFTPNTKKAEKTVAQWFGKF